MENVLRLITAFTVLLFGILINRLSTKERVLEEKVTLLYQIDSLMNVNNRLSDEKDSAQDVVLHHLVWDVETMRDKINR